MGDRFPNYLDHIDPEHDPLATRTLFAGNLELNITDEEMRRIFGRYGELVDIDIKRPPPGTGNAFAFVRFKNLDMAALAKKELSGQYIGKFQCKIGYGKANATTKIWIGGLGPWCTRQMIERESSHLIVRCCGGVNALILDGRPPVLLLVGDLGKGPEPVELPLDHLPSTPGPKAPDPDLGGGVGLAIADLALELANVLPAQLFLGQGGHVKILEPDEGKGVAGAWRGALDVDVHQLAISPENSSHLFICDVELEVA